MEPERFDAELDRLRDAWRAARPATPPSAELEHEDAATRASVDWMRRAWNEVGRSAGVAPNAPASLRLRRNAARRKRLFLAAAALLAASALPWVLAAARDALEARQRDVALAPRDSHGDRELPRDVPTEPAPESRPRVEAIGRDQLVLRSGPVRLYLATGPSALAEDPRNTETHR